MKLTEISKPQTAAQMNENLAKTFGQRIDLNSFTLEQLQDRRNKLRTKLRSIETMESYDVTGTKEYHKNKMMLDVLNAAISERYDIQNDESVEDNSVEVDEEQIDELTAGYSDSAAELQKAITAGVSYVAKQGKDVTTFTVSSLIDLGKKVLQGTVDAYNKQKDGHGAGMTKTSGQQAQGAMANAKAAAANKAVKQSMYDESIMYTQGSKIAERGETQTTAQAVGKAVEPTWKKIKKRFKRGVKNTTGIDLGHQNLKGPKLQEGAEEQAELVMAAKDLVTTVGKWLEDVAEMQSQSMLKLQDAIRDELGSEQATQFSDQTKPTLQALYQALEASRDALNQGVAMLTGEGAPPAEMGAEGAEAPAPEGEMEPTVAADEAAAAGGDPAAAMADEFAGAEAAGGGAEAAGRPARESVQFSRTLGQILSSKKK